VDTRQLGSTALHQANLPEFSKYRSAFAVPAEGSVPRGSAHVSEAPPGRNNQQEMPVARPRILKTPLKKKTKKKKKKRKKNIFFHFFKETFLLFANMTHG